MTRGVDVDVLKVANRVGMQCEAIEYKNLAEEESLLQNSIIADDRMSHQTFH